MSPLARELVTTLAAAIREDDGLAAELAELLAPHLPKSSSGEGFLTAQGAADHLGVTRKRIHDLTSARALVPDGRDGRTPLFLRATLDAYARSQAG